MTTLYYLGSSDTHRLEEPRAIQFHRADDEPFPYAHVSAKEATELITEYPSLYALKDAESEPVGPKDALTVADLDAATVAAKAPAKKPSTRKAKPAAPSIEE